jgi:hypothetical protein
MASQDNQTQAMPPTGQSKGQLFIFNSMSTTLYKVQLHFSPLLQSTEALDIGLFSIDAIDNMRV